MCDRFQLRLRADPPALTKSAPPLTLALITFQLYFCILKTSLPCVLIRTVASRATVVVDLPFCDRRTPSFACLSRYAAEKSLRLAERSSSDVVVQYLHCTIK